MEHFGLIFWGWVCIDFAWQSGLSIANCVVWSSCLLTLSVWTQSCPSLNLINRLDINRATYWVLPKFCGVRQWKWLIILRSTFQDKQSLTAIFLIDKCLPKLQIISIKVICRLLSAASFACGNWRDWKLSDFKFWSLACHFGLVCSNALHVVWI